MNAKKAVQKKDSLLMSIRFSIGAKLITIITIIVLVSLGSITALVSWLIRQDLRIAAEDNNFEVNRRASMVAEYTLASMRSNSMILMQAVNALGTENELARQTVEMFFEQNQQVAVILYAFDGKDADYEINTRYFLSQELDPTLPDLFFENNRADLRRVASGETILLNAAPWFKISLLALLFPWRGGVGGIMFSPQNLSDSFGFGTNQSYLINDSGDILIHSDFTLVRGAVNTAEKIITNLIWDSPQKNAQITYTDEEGVRYFGAFTKLNVGGTVVITSIEFDKVFEGIDATTRRNIYLTFTVLSLSIMGIWFFAKSISFPLRALAAAARTIEGGAFEVELRAGGRDEIGVLTTSFQRMSAALGIFGRFTNRDVAVRAMRGEIKPGGLQKHATIFFSDIRSFTEKSENFTITFGEEASNRMVHWLNDYFTHMVECVEKTGGVVDKFIGDGMMAHWGTAYTAGTPQRDAFNSIKTALMMRGALHEMNKNRSSEDPGNPPIRIGCGINTGIVTAGQIGSDLRMEYTVIGEPVNVAYRIESMNKPMATDILISENTWNLVKNYFITEEMVSVTLKGFEKPIRLFAVINFAGIDKGPRTIADVRKLLGISPMPQYKRRSSDINDAEEIRPSSGDRGSRK